MNGAVGWSAGAIIGAEVLLGSLAVMLIGLSASLLPWGLALAAGAMLGFVLMMILDNSRCSDGYCQASYTQISFLPIFIGCQRIKLFT